MALSLPVWLRALPWQGHGPPTPHQARTRHWEFAKLDLRLMRSPRSDATVNAKSRTTRQHQAAWAGFDLSTTGLALGVRSRSGEEAYAQTRMRGAKRWKGQPAFDLQHVPPMILELLDELEAAGWSFEKLALSFSVRQHDMVLLSQDGQCLIPALSWQCNAAAEQVAKLRQQQAESVVGRIEERFILPKLMWALAQQSGLARRVRQVMTTGDWIALQLTGRARLSTSDALSNGLLDQNKKKLAADVIQRAKLNPNWFPAVLQSGAAVGKVTNKAVPGSDGDWQRVRERLAGATVVAGLGDNHATGVGCGLEEDDFQTVVVSAGTSGTINRVSPPNVPLAGNAACFEYYRNRLLLMMLADCCKWYDRFVAQAAPKYRERLDALNELILQADPARLRRVLHASGKEDYSLDWADLTVGEQAASTQYSIMTELLLLVKAMQAEVVEGDTPPDRFVLTGGLSQSTFFQQLFHTGVKLLAPTAKVLVSARKGPLRYQTAAYGALLNAMRPEDPHAAERLCPTRSIKRPTRDVREGLAYLLRSAGL